MTTKLNPDVQKPSLSHWLHPKQWGLNILLILLAMVAYLPLSWQRTVGAGIGLLLHKLIKKRRIIAQKNIQLCFPEYSQDKVAQVARDAFKQMGMTMTEMGIAWFRDFRVFSDKVTFEGLEHFLAAQKNEQGVLLVSGHWFCMELCIGFLNGTLKGDGAIYPVYRPNENAIINYLYQKNRQWACGDIVNRQDFRKMVRTLKTGGNLWYAPDQDFGLNNTVFAPFFGQSTSTLTATTTLKKMTKATILGFSFTRTGKDNWHLKIEPVDIDGTNTLNDATQYNQFLERNIVDKPEQYLWMHKRFKTRPEGEESIY